MLDDIMLLATKMVFDPDENLPEIIKTKNEEVLKEAKDHFANNINKREPEYFPEHCKGFRKVLDDISQNFTIIHPTQVFDMIAGTSTGSLIAFALVCGNYHRNKLIATMSVSEVIEMYRTATKNIFLDQSKISWWKWKDKLIQKIGYNRSQRGLETELKQKFGYLRLYDIPASRPKDCIPAAVAKRLASNETEKDSLEIFDTYTDSDNIEKKCAYTPCRTRISPRAK